MPKEKNINAPAEKNAAAIVSVEDPKFPTISPAKQQEILSAELFGKAEKMDYHYTEYGKKCALNAIVAAQSLLHQNKKTFAAINMPIFMTSLHNLAVVELNCAALPSEVFPDLRGDVLVYRPQGAGNEQLVRRFGVGVKKGTGLHPAWIIREGDEFSLPQYDGLEIVPPKWKRKTISGKAIAVVYPVEQENGDVEYLMADRSSVIANVVALCRQNALYGFVKKDANGNPLDAYGNLAYPKGKYRPAVDAAARDKYYEDLNEAAEKANGDLDAFLANPIVRKFVNPTYLSFGSKESMIVTKMKNNALKPYPKYYADSIAKEAASMMEDRDDSLDEKPQGLIEAEARDVIEQAEEETSKPNEGDAVADFSVDEDTGEIAKPQPKKPEAKKPIFDSVKEEGEEDEFGGLI